MPLTIDSWWENIIESIGSSSESLKLLFGLASMFTIEQNTYFLEAYFCRWFRREVGTWKYSLQICNGECILQFPNKGVEFGQTFRHHVRRIGQQFRQTGSVCEGRCAGRNTIISNETVEDIQVRMLRNRRHPCDSYRNK